MHHGTSQTYLVVRDEWTVQGIQFVYTMPSPSGQGTHAPIVSRTWPEAHHSRVIGDSSSRCCFHDPYRATP